MLPAAPSTASTKLNRKLSLRSLLNFPSLSSNLVTRFILGGTTLLVGVGAYLSYQTVRQTMLESLKQDALSRVERRGGEIDYWLATLKTRVEMLANTESVRSVDWSIAKPYLQAEDERIQDFTLIGLTTPDGWRESTVAKSRRANVRDRQWFQTAMTGQIYVDNPFVSRATGAPVVAIAAPVFKDGNQSRPPIGVVHGSVTIDRIKQVINQLKYGDSSYAFILSSEGRAIVHPNPTFMSTVEKPALKLTDSTEPDLAMIAQQMVKQQRGIELTTIDGVEKYVAFLPLREANWSIALVIPRENIESQLRLLDGIAFVVLALAGTLIGVLVYVQSTEQAQLKKSKLAADAANQAKSEFLSNMSHELRTPLNGILGYAQILNRSKTWGEKEQRGIAIIHQCGSHLLTLINDILDLSKIEARKLDLSTSEFHLPSFLQSVAEICRIRAEQKGIMFVYRIDERLPSGIRADEKRLRQVLINLLGNAIKFTDIGSVTFLIESINSTSSEKSGLHTLRFSIKDTGVGMTPEQLTKIFLPFEQVGDTKKQAEGTGLGLAISHKIVTLMGSKIEVQSEAGKGSTFWFDLELPEAQEWAINSRNLNQGVILGYQGKQRKILVVDDRWENRSVIVSLLEPLGFEVIEAKNGQEGLEATIAQSPDLIITDLMMPVMDGYQFLKQIRESERLKDMVAIASSASVFESNQQEAIDAGANMFLPKPVQADLLLKTLQQQLQLEWVYEQSTAQQSGAASDVTQPIDVTPPAPEVLQHLLMLVQDGDTQGILEVAECLLAKDPILAPFTQKITNLASQFQLKQLKMLIERYLPNSN